MTANRRWIPIVAGVVVLAVCLGIVAIALSVAYFNEHATVERNIDGTRASEAFVQAANRFPDPRPVVEFDAGGRPRYVEGIAGRKNPGAVTTVYVLAWDPKQRTLVSVTLPMWLLRLKAGPIDLSTYVSGLGNRVRLEVADLDRYGPGVLFDATAAAGDRVLLSAQ